VVDGRTEHQILHNVRRWWNDRTVIISAHRLSALTEASEILVMQHGSVVGRGEHPALATQPVWYRIYTATSSWRQRWMKCRTSVRKR